MVINPEQLEVLEVGGESGNGCAGDLVCEARSVVGTIHVTALLAQLCIRHDLVMLSTDRDFSRIADWMPLQLWRVS